MSYNSWPIGNVPAHLQRQDFKLAAEVGYDVSDPREYITLFEEKVAKFAGSRFAVAVDCCSNGIFLCLKYKQYVKESNIIKEITIPANTYVSVPMQIIHAGHKPIMKRKSWSGIYRLEPTNIYDAAARFVEDMYIKGSYMVLSFQIKKRLPIGKGGMILLNDEKAYHWLKLASYDGRDLNTPYNSDNHVNMLGYHMYMTPEDAARGLWLFDKIKKPNKDMWAWSHYPDLRKIKCLNR